MTQKLTNRFNEKDPFGIGTFLPEANAEWFPGGTKPAVVTPALSSQPAEALVGPSSPPPPQPSPLHTLGDYRAKQETATAAPSPPAVLAPSTSPMLASSPTVARPSSPAPSPSLSPSLPLPAAPTDADLIRDEMKLQLLRGMFPQHSITPVEYDPWKAVPQGLGAKVDVNAGVG